MVYPWDYLKISYVKGYLGGYLWGYINGIFNKLPMKIFNYYLQGYLEERLLKGPHMAYLGCI
jgi:hypothetical protein